MKLKLKLTLGIAAVSVLPFSSYATMWANQPQIDFPASALPECIDGTVTVEFHIVDGQPVDMQIVRSEPDNLYTSSFLEWWDEYDKWRKQVGMLWDDDTVEGEKKEITFNFRPCNE